MYIYKYMYTTCIHVKITEALEHCGNSDRMSGARRSSPRVLRCFDSQ